MSDHLITITLSSDASSLVDEASVRQDRTARDIVEDAIRRQLGSAEHHPTEREIALIDEAIAEADRDPDGGRSWDEVHAGLRAKL